MSIVSIENLNYFYGKKQILKELKLDIDENKLTGIIGPNGCGKSTLAKNIIKYINGKFESFKIMDTDIRELSHKKIAQLISYIPQKSTIISNISVFDYVLLGRFPLLKNSWDNYSEKDYEIVENNISLLNIEELRDRNVETLSGGELQKVLLARALAQRTECLVLDEPTNHLDIKYQLELMTIEKRLDATVVSAIHDLNLAAIYCDRLIALKDGSVVCTGTPHEVLTEDTIRHIYGVSATVQTLPNGRLNIIYNME